MTNRSVVDWILELVAEPLSLRTMLRCMRDGQAGPLGVTGCYARSRKGNDLLYMDAAAAAAPDELLLRRVGVESPIPTGFNVVASTHDVLTMVLALIPGRGSIAGRRVFSDKAARLLAEVKGALTEDLHPQVRHACDRGGERERAKGEREKGGGGGGGGGGWCGG